MLDDTWSEREEGGREGGREGELKRSRQKRERDLEGRMGHVIWTETAWRERETWRVRRN